MIEALGHREQERDDAERLLAMLRVTLNARIEAIRMERATARYRTGSERWCADLDGRVFAYEDVLCLLGPEEPTDTSEEPF